jgi:glycosyltransferase involved in cell wall biosynthesis
VDTLIHAIHASKPPIKCTIVGTGSARDSILELITHLKLTDQISVLGSCEQDKLGDIYRNLDFLVFPSELEESLGLVGLEAMSCGTPVIGSRKGGMAEYIAPDVNGLAFAPGNAESLASAMKEAFTMSSQAYADMSSNAHQTSKAYDARHCAERLVQVFS